MAGWRYLSAQHTSTIGYTGGERPERYPIFHQLSSGRRKDSAQRLLLILTPWREWKALCASYPWVSPLLSPGLRCQTLRTPSAVHGTQTDTGVYPGCTRESMVGKDIPTVVYTQHGREAYTHHGVHPGIPPYVHPPYVHPGIPPYVHLLIYTRYIPPWYTCHTLVYTTRHTLGTP